MSLIFKVALNATPEQHKCLVELQFAFSHVCNALAPVVRDTRVWNRVALHHMAYKKLREQFPAIGSQMICNAIYSVSRTCRTIFQTPGSPFHHNAQAGRPLPLLKFTENSPVYFDRHTLSMKNGVVSLYTLQGRIRFHLTMNATDEQAFHERKLQEVILQRYDSHFALRLVLSDEISIGLRMSQPSQTKLEAISDDGDSPEPHLTVDTTRRFDGTTPSVAQKNVTSFLPDYIHIESPA